MKMVGRGGGIGRGGIFRGAVGIDENSWRGGERQGYIGVGKATV